MREGQPVQEWTEESRTLETLRRRYLHFATSEARGVSPLYEALALAVAQSEPLLRFVAALPPAKQQPNLVFAAVRHLFGTPGDEKEFTRLLLRYPDQIRQLILARRTQTNEPGRCATLLPVLALLPQPIALLEVGASAGLCLLPDHWAYDYGRACLAPRVAGADEAPCFPCSVNDATPLPSQAPEVTWRIGMDLNPVDLRDAEEVAWLETLVWPGQEERAARLRAAIRVAQAHPPPVVKGDLVTDLRAVASAAPRASTLVIFHSAVLAYVSPEDRRRFVDTVTGLNAVWISNEGITILPQSAAKRGEALPHDRFLLSMDGEPLALTAPHGQSMEWFSG